MHFLTEYYYYNDSLYFFIDLFLFSIFLLTALLLALEEIFNPKKYKENDKIYNIIFFIFMFTLGSIIAHIILSL